jgi:hypothetical protein
MRYKAGRGQCEAKTRLSHKGDRLFVGSKPSVAGFPLSATLFAAPLVADAVRYGYKIFNARQYQFGSTRSGRRLA